MNIIFRQKQTEGCRWYKNASLIERLYNLRISSSMSAVNRQGTFWVIDGVRVKKKQPYLVTQVDRILHVNTPKPQKNPDPHLPVSEPAVPVGERYFFTEKSYEDFADKRIDYGMIRFSSLSSLKGDLFAWGQHHEGQHNFSAYGSNDNFKDASKKTIFENQFSVFEYVDEESQEQSQNIMMKQ